MQLLERMALGDPLGAEGDVHRAAALGEVLGHVAGRARVDGAPQGHQGAVTEMRRDLVDRLLEDRHRWAEEFVDRGADDDHEVIGPLDHRAVGPEGEAARREDLAQQLVGAVLHERHLARGDPVERRLVGVVDADPQAGFGEGEAQGQADMAAAAEDDDVEVGGGIRSWRGLYQPGALRHRTPMVPAAALVLRRVRAEYDRSVRSIPAPMLARLSAGVDAVDGSSTRTRGGRVARRGLLVTFILVTAERLIGAYGWRRSGSTCASIERPPRPPSPATTRGRLGGWTDIRRPPADFARLSAGSLAARGDRDGVLCRPVSRRGGLAVLEPSSYRSGGSSSRRSARA